MQRKCDNSKLAVYHFRDAACPRAKAHEAQLRARSVLHTPHLWCSCVALGDKPLRAIFLNIKGEKYATSQFVQIENG